MNFTITQLTKDNIIDADVGCKEWRVSQTIAPAAYSFGP